jgi:hypothetical protein
MRKTTNLNDIRGFVAAEVGTFSAASANVEPGFDDNQVADPTRKHLDLLLVCPSQRGPALPHAGRNILLYCKKSAAALARGRELLDKHRASPSGGFDRCGRVFEI